MSELEQLQDVSEDDVIESSIESPEVQDEAPESDEPNYEERARQMGWAPKEEWRGDEDKWKSAREFVEDGERIIPILKQNNRKLESDVTELKQTMSEMREFFKKAEERNYDKAKKEIEAKMREAVRDGDTESFDKYSREAEDLKESYEAPTQNAQVPPEFSEWKASNSWVDTDQEASTYANSIANYIGQQYPTLTYREKLDKVAEEVKRRFPEKFENPRRKGAPSVEAPRNAPPRNSKKRSYENLPPEAKAQCEKFMRTIKGFTKEEYVSNYDWEK